MTVATPHLALERELLASYPLIIACDEVGRGALAGPVAVGAVVVDAACCAAGIPEGLRDSKLVPAASRGRVADRARAWVRNGAVGWADAAEVDERGIIGALGAAALRAIAAVRLADSAGPAIVLLDGNHDYLTPAGLDLPVRTVIKGDRDCASLAAASVLAKVARDAHMAELARDAPAYGWEANKGYASAAHRDALHAHGVSAYHRQSWALLPADPAPPTLW